MNKLRDMLGELHTFVETGGVLRREIALLLVECALAVARDDTHAALDWLAKLADEATPEKGSTR